MRFKPLCCLVPEPEQYLIAFAGGNREKGNWTKGPAKKNQQGDSGTKV